MGYDGCISGYIPILNCDIRRFGQYMALAEVNLEIKIAFMIMYLISIILH